MVNIISKDNLLQSNRQRSETRNIPYMFNGRAESIKRTVESGQADQIQLENLSGEMVVSTDIKRTLAQKTVLDVELGREEVPLLYAPIYDTLTDANFPRLLDAKWANEGAVVFLEHLEGEEIKFGALNAKEGPVARLTGYTAGFQWTKETELFNEVYLIDLFNRAFGRAHNILLNHIHLNPIAKFEYKSTHITQPKYIKTDGSNGTTATANLYLSTRETLKQGILDSRIAKRPGNILLANSADQYQIEEALQGASIAATNYKTIAGIDTIIYYDGDTEQVGDSIYEFEGVKPGEAFLIRPKRGFKELVKVPLRIEFGGGDITRLVEDTMVGYTFRGIFAALEENVQKIILPGRE